MSDDLPTEGVNLREWLYDLSLSLPMDWTASENGLPISAVIDLLDASEKEHERRMASLAARLDALEAVASAARIENIRHSPQDDTKKCPLCVTLAALDALGYENDGSQAPTEGENDASV